MKRPRVAPANEREYEAERGARDAGLCASGGGRNLHQGGRLAADAEANGDDQAPFDPNYFVGAWTIRGVLPDSPLGAGGEFTGTETVRHVDSCTYESTIRATVPEGKVTINVLMVYDRRAEYMVRLEDDSRGFRLLKVGHVGGDPGGYASHFWEAPPVTRQGSQVRLKGRTLVTSPDSYRLPMQISVDGRPFANFGSLQWERELPRP